MRSFCAQRTRTSYIKITGKSKHRHINLLGAVLTTTKTFKCRFILQNLIRLRLLQTTSVSICIPRVPDLIARHLEKILDVRRRRPSFLTQSRLMRIWTTENNVEYLTFAFQTVLRLATYPVSFFGKSNFGGRKIPLFPIDVSDTNSWSDEFRYGVSNAM